MVDESNTRLMRDYVLETSHAESEKWPEIAVGPLSRNGINSYDPTIKIIQIAWDCKERTEITSTDTVKNSSCMMRWYNSVLSCLHLSPSAFKIWVCVQSLWRVSKHKHIFTFISSMMKVKMKKEKFKKLRWVLREIDIGKSLSTLPHDRTDCTVETMVIQTVVALHGDCT